MKDNEISKTLKQKIQTGYSSILAGIEQMAEGSKMITECLDEDRDATKNLLAQRGVSDEFLDLIESVGRGRLHPKLMFMPGPGPERIHRAPLKEQERLINTGVVVAKLVGDEQREVVKPLMELTAAESVLALNAKGQVPVADQWKQIEQRMLNTTFKLPPFSVDGDTLIARANVRIPFSDLEVCYQKALKAHERKLKTLESDVKRKQIVR